MGDRSVVLRGTDDRSARDALRSTVHGAGRVMGRMQAKGRWKGGKLIRPGLVTHRMMADATRGVILRGGDLDEAPQVYRKLDGVIAAQGSTVEVLHTLTPLIVCMAPSRTVDPYKD
jgi:tRNA-splicing ligase RtcB